MSNLFCDQSVCNIKEMNPADGFVCSEPLNPSLCSLSLWQIRGNTYAGQHQAQMFGQDWVLCDLHFINHVIYVLHHIGLVHGGWRAFVNVRYLASGYLDTTLSVSMDRQQVAAPVRIAYGQSLHLRGRRTM